MRPEVTSIRPKLTAAPGKDDDGAPPPDFGNHSATFQSPPELRTRLRLGLSSAIAPNSMCPQKIFVAEARVFAERDGVRLKRWAAPQRKIVASHFDAAAEDGSQARRQPTLQARVTDQQRYAQIRQPQKNQQTHEPFGPTRPGAPRRPRRIQRRSVQFKF